VELIDVAGLVPGAHEGKGLGNKFLDDLRQASVLIHVIDASGGTDAEGNPVDAGTHDPMEDIRFLEEEIDLWIFGILTSNWRRISKTAETLGKKPEAMLAEKLAGLGINEHQIHAAIRPLGLPERPSSWSEEEILSVSRAVRKESKPMIIVANKADMADESAIKRLMSMEDYIVIPTSAEYELALRRAAKAGLIEYEFGASDFKVLKPDALNHAQQNALDRIREFMDRFGSTGVQNVIERATFELLDLITVYPVEDETHWTDHNGNVLPDAYLMPRGSTAKDLAYKVHTDLGDNFIRAIDGRTGRVIGHDHELKDGDVIKIVART
jgi:ribosome-binding ATPase YchF (GTP1/OBG family)